MGAESAKHVGGSVWESNPPYLYGVPLDLKSRQATRPNPLPEGSEFLSSYSLGDRLRLIKRLLFSGMILYKRARVCDTLCKPDLIEVL